MHILPCLPRRVELIATSFLRAADPVGPERQRIRAHSYAGHYWSSPASRTTFHVKPRHSPRSLNVPGVAGRPTAWHSQPVCQDGDVLATRRAGPTAAAPRRRSRQIPVCTHPAGEFRLRHSGEVSARARRGTAWGPVSLARERSAGRRRGEPCHGLLDSTDSRGADAAARTGTGARYAVRWRRSPRRRQPMGTPERHSGPAEPDRAVRRGGRRRTYAYRARAFHVKLWHTHPTARQPGPRLT